MVSECEWSIDHFISYLLLTMNSDDKPMSLKDRIAMFQGIINNSPSPSPTLKQPPPKQSPPSQVTPPTVSPPANNTSTSQQGQVESPSIIKPSAAKQLWLQKTQPTQNNPQKKNIQVPAPRAPEPKKAVQIQSPDVVKPSVARQTWQPSSQSITQNDNFLKILEAANKQSQPQVQTVKQSSPQVSKPAQSNENQVKEQSLTPAAIRQMLEGKMANMNRQSMPVYPKTVIPKPQSQNAQKQTPTVSVKVEAGTVKGNTQKLNQFFEAQKEQQKARQQEDRRKKAQILELKPEVISPVKKQDVAKPISQNIVFPSQTTVSPGLGVASPGLTQHNQLDAGESSELGMLARLKRKKRTKERFSSDSD